jgi:hypothetical protein
LYFVERKLLILTLVERKLPSLALASSNFLAKLQQHVQVSLRIMIVAVAMLVSPPDHHSPRLPGWDISPPRRRYPLHHPSDQYISTGGKYQEDN